MALINILKTIPLFALLTEAERELLAGLLRRKSIKKHELLFRQGDEGTAFYIILQGRIKISVSRRREKVTLAILGPGEFLGEMALLDGLPRSADAAALEDSQLYALNRKDFLFFLGKNENAVRAILHSLSKRLRKTDDQLAEMCFLNLSARLAKQLVEMAAPQSAYENHPESFSVIISQQELGNILGVSRESINKELRILRDKGCVSTLRNTIIIKDLESLRRRMP
ncbi:MAG: Crp/Fnr family transcriptional regulator [Syntrophobacterales bacterium]|nr:Crp/Fnr family transcriptional regulator [Syntrophobacterales bacterium]